MPGTVQSLKEVSGQSLILLLLIIGRCASVLCVYSKKTCMQKVLSAVYFGMRFTQGLLQPLCLLVLLSGQKRAKTNRKKKPLITQKNFPQSLIYTLLPRRFLTGEKSRISEHSRNKFALKALYAVTASLFHALTIKQVYRAGSG